MTPEEEDNCNSEKVDMFKKLMTRRRSAKNEDSFGVYPDFVFDRLREINQIPPESYDNSENHDPVWKFLVDKLLEFPRGNAPRMGEDAKNESMVEFPYEDNKVLKNVFFMSLKPEDVVDYLGDIENGVELKLDPARRRATPGLKPEPDDGWSTAAL